MNIYLLEQEINTGYDTYDSCVVIAENENDARQIHPSDFVTHVTDNKWMGTYSGGNKIGDEYEQSGYDWVEYSQISEIKVLGVAFPYKQRLAIGSFLNILPEAEPTATFLAKQFAVDPPPDPVHCHVQVAPASVNEVKIPVVHLSAIVSISPVEG